MRNSGIRKKEGGDVRKTGSYKGLKNLKNV